MPTIKKVSAPPPPKAKARTSATVGAQKGFKSQQKKDPAARKRPITADIYGEEVLQPLIKKEKEIVICFYPFTKNDLRISTEGKFAIEQFKAWDATMEELETLPKEELVQRNHETHWNLYYFPEPITDFVAPTEMEKFKEIDYLIDLTLCESFRDFADIKELENKVVALVRAEFFADRQKKLEDLEEQDRLFAEDQARIEKELEESEGQENDLDRASTEEFKSDSESEDEGMQHES